MSERNMRQRINKALRNLDAISVENHVYPGTPDVNFADGWIELKQLGKWPRRSNAIVKVDHFRPEQRSWLRRRSHNGGNVYLLIQIASDWLLFKGCVASKLLGKVDRAKLEARAIQVWTKHLDEAELESIVQKNHNCTCGGDGDGE